MQQGSPAGLRSAKVLAERVAAEAYTAAGKPMPDDKKEPVPLVPIFIGVDRDTFATPQEPLREMFLYRYGDKQWSSKPAASRLVLETGLPGNYEKLVDSQILAGLEPYKHWSDPGREQLVKLQLYVRLRDEAFVDEVLWDVGSPTNNPDGYAIRVCEDLRLACDWYDAIRGHLERRLKEIQQDLREAPEDVELQPPVKRLRRSRQQQPGEQQQQQLPRVEPYDAAKDIETPRQAAREQLLAARAARRQEQQQAAQQEQAAATEQPHPAALGLPDAGVKPLLQQQQQGQPPVSPQQLQQQQQQQYQQQQQQQLPMQQQPPQLQIPQQQQQQQPMQSPAMAMGQQQQSSPGPISQQLSPQQQQMLLQQRAALLAQQQLQQRQG